MTKETLLVLVIVSGAIIAILLGIFVCAINDKNKNKSNNKPKQASNRNRIDFDEDEEEEPKEEKGENTMIHSQQEKPEQILKSTLTFSPGTKITVNGTTDWRFHFQQGTMIYLNQSSSKNSIQFFGLDEIEKAEWDEEDNHFTLTKNDEYFIVMETNINKKPLAIFVYDMNGRQVL